MPQGELGCTYLTAGCEINLTQLPAGFGVAQIATFDPDIKRMYNVEETISIQHEVVSQVSVSAGWYHCSYKNLRRRTNVLQTFDDYTPFTMWSPIDGSSTTYYNVNRANVLNSSPVYAVRSLNYGTSSYQQPQSILVGRVFQLGAIVRF